jgi:hypothetical protein
MLSAREIFVKVYYTEVPSSHGRYIDLFSTRQSFTCPRNSFLFMELKYDHRRPNFPTIFQIFHDRGLTLHYYNKANMCTCRYVNLLHHKRFISFNNFNAQFLYSLTIRMLHYNPRHVSSINMPIFRRTNCIITAWYRHSVNGCTECDDTRFCDNTICPPEDGHVDARNMSKIVM